MVDWESFKVSLHSKFVLFHWLNGWSRHIWYAILLNDNMDLQISSLGTLVPKGPWCVFYATRRQVYWGLTHMFFTGTLIWYYTHTHTHTTHTHTHTHTQHTHTHTHIYTTFYVLTAATFKNLLSTRYFLSKNRFAMLHIFHQQLRSGDSTESCLWLWVNFHLKDYLVFVV